MSNINNIFGSHIDSNINDLIINTEKIKSFGGNLVQIFVDPLNKKNNKYNKYNEFKIYLDKNKIKLEKLD